MMKTEVGAQFMSSLNGPYNGKYWYCISTVLSVEPPSTRFGQPDQIVMVRIATTEGTIIETGKRIWVSQLQQGLI